ncbi:MAG: ATP-binding protein [Defluviitaleaceae bacterium]|nr:ATP-binding protein [Defluviitaleaceae bacterium]MCL2261989.1 ATP-binding protein [Defluviitaleaceae bacterium]
MNSIRQLASSFIKEALASPILMNDLATMEMYIAESYTGRSLIELLQNADDAGATQFLVQSINKTTFVAANNGRPFTSEDLIALCRSGASTKQRKSNAIGFRGIGFKAVVNYAENVHVLSGEYQFTFSRSKTADLLPCDIKVPLIRIPHEYTETKYRNMLSELTNRNFNTIFIFETENNKLEQELHEFTPDCLLFLNHISNVELKTEEMSRITEINKSENEHGTLFNFGENEWLVIKSENKSAIALKWDNGKIIPCKREEAVVHSFLPTQEFLTVPMKVNGDFSTEPSRTRVSLDDETKIAVSSCAKIVARLYKRILTAGEDDMGFINIMTSLYLDPISKLRGLKINDLLNEEFIKAIREITSAHFASQNKKAFIYSQNG